MNDKKKYTAKDIRLYLEGKLSPSQMHELEKAALEDPFLADALEGMELYNDQKKFSADTNDLNARLNERIKKKGALLSIHNLWWKIASVLVIIITGISVITFMGETNKLVTTEIAKTENKREAASIPDTLAKDVMALTQPVTDTSKQPIVKKKSAIDRGEKEIARAQGKEEVSRADIAPQYSAPRATTNPEKDAVVSAEGIVHERNQQAKVAEQLSGKAAGIVVKDEDFDDSSLNEVVIVGYSINSKRTMNRSRAMSAERTKKRVAPENGWNAFERYIKDSTIINTADSVYTGEELIKFTIGDEGTPGSIEILKSISPSHDKEAMRLLQNGPAWKVLKGNKRVVTLRIIF